MKKLIVFTVFFLSLNSLLQAQPDRYRFGSIFDDGPTANSATTDYNLTFNGTTTYNGIVTFDAELRVISTSLIVSADGDTAEINVGTAASAIDVEIGNNKIFRVDTVGAMALGNGALANHGLGDILGVKKIVFNSLDANSPPRLLYATELRFQSDGGGVWFLNATSNTTAFFSNDNWVGFGTTTAPSAGGGAGTAVFADTGTPPTPGTNTAAIFGDDVAGTVHMFATEEGDGTGTQLSSHNSNGEPIHFSYSSKTGKATYVNLVKLAKAVERLTEEQLVFQVDFDKENPGHARIILEKKAGDLK